MNPTLSFLLSALLAFSLSKAGAEPTQKHVLRDITYARVGDLDLKLDLHLPATSPRSPLFVWVHGGAWRAGSKDSMPLGRLVDEGYAVASVDYRLSTQARFPAQVHDIKAAIRFVRGHGDAWRLPAATIVVAGDSAGGHLAALVGVSNGHAELEGDVGTDRAKNSGVQGIISFYGGANLTTILKQSTPHGLTVRVPALDLLLGGQPDDHPALARLASPVFHVDKSDPPLLLIHGDQDPQMPVNQALELEGAYRQAKLPVQLEVIHGAAHGGPRFYDEERLDIVRSFLNRHFKNAPAPAAEHASIPPPLGYTELRTDLPGGRHANVRTMRAMIVNADGTGRREVGAELLDEPDAWTQFAGWSPDGRHAILSRGWQNPDNARWEEEHRTFRMDPGQWKLDSFLLDMAGGRLTNLTAVERVSHYNGGLFYVPGGRSLGFTPLIDGVSKPYLMDPDGRNKRDVSGKNAGFAYGYTASPDGSMISYHEDYQVFIANADGSGKRRIDTGNPFNFGPRWSADGQWLMFVSGERGRSNPHVVRRDGTGLRKLADLNGYQGWILFLDVPDFHEGSSDVPVWSADGKSVFYTAKVEGQVELFQVTLDGHTTRLTRTPNGTLHYHPQPSPDGGWLAYGSLRDGVRQLFVMRLADHSERRITELARGHGAMWPYWRPVPSDTAIPQVTVASVRRIFHNGEHNAFTDLCRYRGQLYLTFRTCPDGHMVHPNASIIVLRSPDGGQWTEVHRFHVDQRDTRDPHFLVFGDKLFVYTGTWYSGPTTPRPADYDLNQHLGFGVWSDDGSTWHGPMAMDGTFGHYIWRATAFDGKAYLCGRRKPGFEITGRGEPATVESLLLESDDGLIWRKKGVFQETVGDETAFLFEPDGVILGIGRHGTGKEAQLLRSRPPYTHWERTNLDQPIGGPLLAKWGARHLVGGRKSTRDRGPKTALFWLNGGSLTEFAELPSGGDNSYPGFVALSATRALVSYYSSHERDASGRPITAIYLAELQMK